MKFCQVDGTELVADEPAFDPYATVVGHKLDLTKEESFDKPGEDVYASDDAVAGPSAEASVEETAAGESLVAAEVSPIHETTGSIPIGAPDEILELPGIDPLKTMYVTESELKEAFGTGANETLTEESIMSEPPAAGFGEMAPPPSPFSARESPLEQAAVDPSPYADAETVLAQDVIPPFRQQEPAPVAEWNPPDAAWQGQPAISNTPAEEEGQNKGLAIGALVAGILSCTVCCWLGLFVGPVAMGLGFMAKKKAEENPTEFGGGGLALGGIIAGAVGFLIGIIIIIIKLFFGSVFAMMFGGISNAMPN